MSSKTIAGKALSSFEDFMNQTSPDEFGKHERCLADYIAAWVRSGRGVRICAGDFQAYLMAVIAIIDAWLKNPGILDYPSDAGLGSAEPELIERRVTTIYGPEPYPTHKALDSHWFAMCVFEELHGLGSGWSHT